MSELDTTTALHACLRKHGIDPDSIECGAFCGPGWVPIVDALLETFERNGVRPVIGQIKSKFGELRFYCTPVPETFWTISRPWIRDAEKLSAQTCEMCGSPGERHATRYITRCPEHM